MVCWGREAGLEGTHETRQRRAGLGFPEPGHWNTQAGAIVALRQKLPHPTHLCASDQTLPSPQG